jgi:hypothetical protein
VAQMRESNAIVAVYETPDPVETDILALKESGFDLGQVSVLGPGDPQNGMPVAYYQMPGRVGCWGNQGRFWTGVGSLLYGWALVSLPEFGPVLVAGPLAMWIVSALDNAALFAGLSAVAAGLYSIGIPRARIMRYEAALKRQRYLIVVHGAAAEVARAEEMLRRARAIRSASRFNEA